MEKAVVRTLFYYVSNLGAQLPKGIVVGVFGVTGKWLSGSVHDWPSYLLWVVYVPMDPI